MLIDLLNTDTDKEKLKIALEVLLEFKGNESQEEWLQASFSTWMRLEQLEEYLEHLVNGKELNDDTRQFMESKYYKEHLISKKPIPAEDSPECGA